MSNAIPSVGRIVHFYCGGLGPFPAIISCTDHEDVPEKGLKDICCLDVSVPPCDQVWPEGPVAAVPRVEPEVASKEDGIGGVTGPGKCWVWPPRV